MDPRLIAWTGRGPNHPERSKSRTKPAPWIFQGNRTIFEGDACSFPRAPPPSDCQDFGFFLFFLFFSEGIKSGSHEKLASGRGLASRGLSEQNSRLRNFSDTTLPCDPGEIRIFAQLRSFWEGEKQGWRLFSLLNPFVSFRSSWASFREFAIVVETRITGANYGSK